jgi:hypothetical protein
VSAFVDRAAYFCWRCNCDERTHSVATPEISPDALDIFCDPSFRWQQRARFFWRPAAAQPAMGRGHSFTRRRLRVVDPFSR